MKKFNSANLYLWAVFILLYFPIIYLVVYSFNAGDSMQGWQGFSWVHYQELFEDSHILVVFLDTLILALSSALIATIVGTMGALLITNQRKTIVKNVLLSLNNVLLVSPDVIIGASFLILFTMIGFSLGFVSVLLAHVAFSIPIVVLMVLPRLREIGSTLVPAAQDLGANGWQVLSRVILPVISPGIMAGFFMAFTYSLDDFAVTFFVTGNGFTTLAVEIYSRARQGVSLEINALSALMFAISLVLVLVYYVISSRPANRKIAKKADMLVPKEHG
ncbi:ABC transporter permease [Eupransor demetentiae]|uniref:Permease component II (PotC) n=1 Tax=Eupransor demetentiae TaxID=3109584 RepID=A0ABM9N637_9LACO|nr:ABC-type spermidine/putrescine transport system [Lactobacillaceae bacterium LMG 33000]